MSGHKRVQTAQLYGPQQIAQILAELTPYQAHGEIYTYENAVSVACATAGTYYSVTGLTDGLNSGSGLVTVDGSNGKITIGNLSPGRYSVRFSMSLEANKANVVCHGDVFKNSSEQQNIAFERSIGTANVIGVVAATGFIDLVADDFLIVKLKSDTNTTTFDIPHMNLNAIRIAGN